MVQSATAKHAIQLFHLSIEQQFGPNWEQSCLAAKVLEAADEIVNDFGAQRVEQELPDAEALWLFPDGSQAATGTFGIKLIAA